MQGERERTRLLFRLVVSLLLLLPLLGNLLAILLGWHVFYLDDARTQFIWGTAALIWGLWPQRPHRQVNALTAAVPKQRVPVLTIAGWLVGLVAVAVYGLSVGHTFFQPRSLEGVLPVYYLHAGVLVSLALLGRLLGSLRQR